MRQWTHAGIKKPLAAVLLIALVAGGILILATTTTQALDARDTASVSIIHAAQTSSGATRFEVVATGDCAPPVRGEPLCNGEVEMQALLRNAGACAITKIQSCRFTETVMQRESTAVGSMFSAIETLRSRIKARVIAANLPDAEESTFLTGIDAAIDDAFASILAIVAAEATS